MKTTLSAILITLLVPRPVTDKQTYSRYEDVPRAYQHLFDTSIPQATYSLLFSHGQACAVSYRDFVGVAIGTSWDCRWKPARS